jgi:hypothetical protein
MSVLGAAGLTSSTLLAKAKNEAQELAGHAEELPVPP